MKAWYVVQTRAGLERAVSKAIKTSDIDVLLPTFKREVFVRGRKEEVIRPLFPLYLFAAFDIEDKQVDWGRILRSVGVQTILGIRRSMGQPIAPLGEKRGANNRFTEGAIPLPVPERVIMRIQKLIHLGGGHVKLNEEPRPAPLARLKPLDRVKVTQGPFDGLEGLVDQDRKTRVWVLLDILGVQRRTDIPREDLTLTTSAVQ